MADAANAGELASSLGVSQRIYERMRGNGAFAPVAAGGSVNQHLLFDAADAALLRELLAERIALASASNASTSNTTASSSSAAWANSN